jgi:hypothetical protein
MGWLDQLRQAGQERQSLKPERVFVEPQAPPERLQIHEAYVTTRLPIGNDPGQV